MYTTGIAPHDSAAISSSAPHQGPGWQRKLLLVDDHELVRYGAKALYTELLGVPLEWLEASTLREALDIYGRESDIDAVLLDLNLSDCKGLQGLRQFVQELPQARIAVFSATQDEFVIRQAPALGAVGYVPKGAVATEMLGTLSALSGRRRARSGRRSPPTRCSRACRRRRCTTASPSSGRATSRSSSSCSPAATTRRSATRCGCRSAR